MKKMTKYTTAVLTAIIIVFVVLYCLDVHDIPSNWGIKLSFWEDFITNMIAVFITIGGTIIIIGWQMRNEKKEREKSDLFSLFMNNMIFMNLLSNISEGGNVEDINSQSTDLNIKSVKFDKNDLLSFLYLLQLFSTLYRSHKMKGNVLSIIDNYEEYFQVISLGKNPVRSYEHFKICKNKMLDEDLFLINKNKYLQLDKDLKEIGIMSLLDKNDDFDFNFDSKENSNVVNLTLEGWQKDQVQEFRREVEHARAATNPIKIYLFDFDDNYNFSPKDTEIILFNEGIKKVVKEIRDLLINEKS